MPQIKSFDVTCANDKRMHWNFVGGTAGHFALSNCEPYQAHNTFFDRCCIN